MLRKIYLILLLCSTQVLADTCDSNQWSPKTFNSEKKGKVIIYFAPNKEFSLENLKCLTAVSFVEEASNIPPKAVVGIISPDRRKLIAIQWSLEEDYLLIIESNADTASGSFIKYPQALSRLKDILLSRPFPSPEQFSPNLRKRLQANYLNASIDGNTKFIEE